MKRKELLIIGFGDLGNSTTNALYQKTLGSLGGLVVVELSRPPELKALDRLIEMDLVNNISPLGNHTVKEPRLAAWPKDSVLVKKKKVNNKGFRRKGINPGRR